MTGQFEAPGTRTLPAEDFSKSSNNRKSIPAMNNFIGKRRSRRGKMAPITIKRAHPADFQAMVQQMTGFPLESSSRAAPSPLKPQPGRMDSNIIPSVLPMFDSSSLGLPVAMNDLFGARHSYLLPAAFCKNLAENSVYSAGTATPSSDIDSHKACNNIQSQIKAFRSKRFLE